VVSTLPGMLGQLRLGLALAVIGLLTAVSAQAQNAAIAPRITTTAGSVTIKFSTAVPTTAIIYTSVDTSYATAMLDSRYKKLHAVTFKAAPGRKYFLKIVATAKNHKSFKFNGGFTIAGAGSVSARITSGNGGFQVNGVPFFPRISYLYGCTDAQSFEQGVATAVNLGNNILEGVDVCSNMPDAQRSQLFGSQLTGKLWLRDRDPASEAQLKDLPSVLDWQATETQIGSGPRGWSADDSYFRAFGCKSTALLYQNALQASGPTVYTMNLGRYAIRSGLQTCVTPSALAAEIWTAIVARVKGFRYASADAGNQDDYDVAHDLSAKASALAVQMDSLQPVLLSGQRGAIPVSSTDVRAISIKYAGAVYVLAVNTASTSQTVSLKSGIASGARFGRLWESGSVKQAKGVIFQHFAPLAVHFYRAIPVLKK
jgi:hypothetical protein